MLRQGVRVGGPERREFVRHRVCRPSLEQRFPIRQLIPHPTIKATPGFLLVRTTPLLEKKGHILRNAPIPDLSNPLALHWSSTRPRLATDDHPINVGQRQSWNRAKQRLNGQKPDRGGHTPKVLDAIE